MTRRILLTLLIVSAVFASWFGFSWVCHVTDVHQWYAIALLHAAALLTIGVLFGGTLLVVEVVWKP